MLVGRGHEIGALTELVREHQSVVVLGEPGIGKTAVLTEALARSGQPALVGGALSMLSTVPFAPVARALDVRGLSGDPARVAQRVLAAVSPGGVLVIEDLHWADPGTIAVLDLVERTVPVVASMRLGHDPDSPGAAFVSRHQLHRLEIGPLDDDDAADLVRRTRHDVDAVTVSRLVRRCAGNPLLLHQLAGPTGKGAESLRIALSTRLATLSGDGQVAFSLLALAGRPVPVSWVAESAAELVRARLAVRTGDSLAVLHAVLAELAAARLGDAERRRLHAQVARLTDDLGEAARHHEAAGEMDRARSCALRAVDDAALPGDAASHLAVAARCSTGPESTALRLRAAADLVLALRAEEALGVLHQVETGDAATQVDVAVLRSRAAWYLGDDDAFRAAIDEAARVGDQAGSQPVARAMVERARRAVFLQDETEDAVTMATQALAAARQAGIPLARAQMQLGLAHYMADDPAWQAALSDALVLARAEDDLDTELTVGNNLITAHESSGDPQSARALCSQLACRAEQVGAAGWQLQFRALALNLSLHQGEVRSVVATALELLEEPLDLRARAQVTAALVVALVDVGSVELALRRLDAVTADPEHELLGRDVVRWLESEADLVGGRSERAIARAQEAIELGFTDPFPLIVQTWAALDLGLAPPILEAIPVPMFAGIRADSVGVDALAAGDHTLARTSFEEAAAGWHRYHRRGEFRSRWGAAEAARLAGDGADATGLLLALEEELEPLGLAPMLARVHRSLRPLGVRRTAPRSARALGGLTDREEAVMQLVASGLTNAEIGRRLRLSRSTVTELVAHAVAALGCQSRGQAAARFLA